MVVQAVLRRDAALGTVSDLLGAPKLVDRYRGHSGAWQDAIGIGDADVVVTLTR